MKQRHAGRLGFSFDGSSGKCVMGGMIPNEEIKASISKKSLFQGIAAIFVVQVIYGLVAWLSFGSSKAGLFGDMFGALNPLFSGLALVGVVFTNYLQSQQLEIQRQDLALQRAELVQNRAELQRSADAQEKTEAAFREQLVAARTSAQLDVLPLLIQEAVQNFRPEFSYKFGHADISVNGLALIRLDDLKRHLSNLEEKYESGVATPDDIDLIEKFRTLIHLRRHFHTLYNSIAPHPVVFERSNP